MLVGSHLSISGGLFKAVEEALRLGLDCVQIFTKNQRQWTSKPLAPEEAEAFRAAVRAAGWDKHPERRLVSHNSYLVNLASPDPELQRKSHAMQLDELQRCEALGVPNCVMHPGAHMGAKGSAADEAAGIDRLVRALDKLHAETRGFRTVTCIENTVGGGTSLGGPFEHLAQIRERVREPERVAVCFDTCHATAYGHDMTTPAKAKAVWKRFDEVVGLEHLRVFHVNDSVGAVGSHLDRHAHLGTGACGEACFAAIAAKRAFANIPCILETPKEGKLRGRDPDRANAAWLRALAMLAVAALVGVALPGCRPWAKPQSQVTEVEQQLPARPTAQEQDRLERARAVAARGDYQQALKDLGSLLQENPRLVDAQVAVAQTNEVQGDLRAAQRGYEAALAADPRNVDARIGLARVHAAAGRREDAIRDYRLALAESPGDRRAIEGIAALLESTGDGAGAIPFLERRCADADADAAAWSRLGRAYLRAGRSTDAVAAYEEAVALGAVAQETLDGLIGAYTAEKRYAEAASAAQEYARRWPGPRADERCAWIEFKLGDFARSAASYRRAVAKDPRSIRAWNGIGACALNAWLLSDRIDGAAREEARQAFEQSLALDPKQPQVQQLLDTYAP
ncbi:MAG: deoxyribonuclease IV [Phycisphaerales bacterium]